MKSKNTPQEKPSFRFAAYLLVLFALACRQNPMTAQTFDHPTQWRRHRELSIPTEPTYPQPMMEYADGHAFAPIMDARDYLAQQDATKKPTGGQPGKLELTAPAKTDTKPDSLPKLTVDPPARDNSKPAKAKARPNDSAKKNSGKTDKPKDKTEEKKPPEIDPRCFKSACGCCGQPACGPNGKSSFDCCPADYRCECSCEKEKVEHECFVVKCEPICIPPVRLPWGHGKFLCGGIKCVKKFSTDKYKCEETVTKWEAKKAGGSCTD